MVVMTGMTELAKIIAFKQIMNLLKNNNFVVIDDHVEAVNPLFRAPWKEDNARKIAGVGINETADGEIKSVVALFKGYPYYSTNSLYVDEEDGMVHLSRLSSGPTIVGDDIQKVNDGLYFGGGISKAIWADGSETEYNLGTDKSKDA